MIHGQSHPVTAKRALNWLVEEKDPHGAWHSTQATVLALKPLLASAGQSLRDDRLRHVDIALDGKTIKSFEIAPDQSDIMQQIDLTNLMTSGSHHLEIAERSAAGYGYQATLTHYAPGAAERRRNEPLTIQVDYDKESLAVDDRITVTATVTNRTEAAAPMVILDLPIPAGCTIETSDLSSLRASGTIAKYQLTPRSAIVYLRELRAGEPLILKYRLQATMPAKITASAGRAYEYYNPDHQAFSEPVTLEVKIPKSEP